MTTQDTTALADYLITLIDAEADATYGSKELRNRLGYDHDNSPLKLFEGGELDGLTEDEKKELEEEGIRYANN